MTGGKKADLGGVARLYTESLEKHGTAAMGVGWHDATSHKLRFEKLAEVIEPEGTSESGAAVYAGVAILAGLALTPLAWWYRRRRPSKLE